MAVLAPKFHYYLGHDHAPPPHYRAPPPVSPHYFLWYPSEFPAPCPALNPHRYGTFRIQFGQFFGLCPVGVFVNDPASVKHILQTGFQSGAYGKGPFFKLQYKVCVTSTQLSCNAHAERM